MYRQGKCVKCRIVVEWPAAEVALADAACPKCGTRLKRTTYLKKWPRVRTTADQVRVANVMFRKVKRHYPYPPAAKYRLTKDGVEKIVGSEQNCWSYILLHSTCSVFWALNHEGWKMEKSS